MTPASPRWERSAVHPAHSSPFPFTRFSLLVFGREVTVPTTSRRCPPESTILLPLPSPAPSLAPFCRLPSNPRPLLSLLFLRVALCLFHSFLIFTFLTSLPPSFFSPSPLSVHLDQRQWHNQLLPLQLPLAPSISSHFWARRQLGGASAQIALSSCHM